LESSPGGAASGGASGGQSGTGSGGAGGSALAACAEDTASCTQPIYPQQLIDWVKAPSFIVKATVTALPFVSPDGWNPDPSKQIGVHIDRVLLGNQAFQSRQLMVVLQNQPSFGVGYVGYFSVDVRVLGQILNGDELGHVDPGVFPEIDSIVPAIQQTLVDRKLYDRMMQAEAVLRGQVANVVHVQAGCFDSEHAPDWSEGTITPSCLFRGSLPAESNPSLRFNISVDVAWVGSPRLEVGEDAIFLQEPSSILDPFILSSCYPAPQTTPLVLDALDVQTLDQSQRLARLLHCPPPQL
jgi:hypothetical protein